ncbi:hypothetical protein D9757_010889 [Collybiopsis confluens]|uniref:Ubiquitin-like protease family profile domain-containing protein n=1 Tax=Collybiopsis confluens TaxID=2823264 RepID=A0A8H5H7Y9_9AGAR|nr:hypothetical protein D9757_010889 [Collybiopsis confluens]
MLPRPPTIQLHNGDLVECLPFGQACRCNVHHFNQLASLVRNCHAYLPFLTLSTLFSVKNAAKYETALNQLFHVSFSTGSNHRLYADVEVQIKRLQEITRQLSAVAAIKSKFLECTRRHANPMTSESQALIVLGNLRILLDCVHNKRTSLEEDWWSFLDQHPRKTEEMLRVLMDDTRNRSDQLWDHIPHMNFHDFSTLGVGRWLNDEIINCFVKKWCTQARTTLGLSTFFACKFLFEDNSCVTTKSGVLTAQEGARILRSCRKTEQDLGFVPSSWDSVFIPIHENTSHWYSAFIDFCYKRIQIYDSLRETCVINCQKPICLRKNTNLMLVLMWLTEILGQMRGDTVCLSNNPETDWVFDPHSGVRFTSNPMPSTVEFTRYGTFNTFSNFGSNRRPSSSSNQM